MRKFLIPAALLASTVAISTPAAAQWAPPVPQGYAYGYQDNGYQNNRYQNHGQVRRIETRIQQIRQDIRQLDRRNILSNKEARKLDHQASDLQRRARFIGRNGVNAWEMRDLEARVMRLQQRVAREVNDGNRRFGHNSYGNYNNGYQTYGSYSDRDRDGRDDRYEDDRGREHDGRRDRDDDHRDDRRDRDDD